MNGEECDRIRVGDDAQIITNQTPFYGESGGQIGDGGSLFSAGGGRMTVSDTQKKLGALHIHVGRVSEGELAVGDDVELRVDGERRIRVRAHHSATHLLHAALRDALGAHVTQKGSLVAGARLRFDISHPKPLTADEVAEVEAAVNAQIRGNQPVQTRLMSPDDAIEAGALALFGEKYGDEVRVLSMGGKGGGPYSVELCGGTHVARTGDIGLFKIVSEGAVAAGVRRLEAIAGDAALRHITQQEQYIRDAADRLKAKPQDVPQRIEALLEERKRFERELGELRRKMASGSEGTGGLSTRNVNGLAYTADVLQGVPAKDLRGMVDEAKKGIESGVVALVSVVDGKAALIVGVTEDLGGRLDAVALARIGVAELGGTGGGGRPDMAQGGGPDGDKAASAIAAIEKAISEST